MKINTAATLTAAAAMLAAVCAAAPAEARCRGDVSAFAVGNFQFSTRITARNRWRSKVRVRYGSAYASWVNAKDKTEQCDKSGPGKKWRCVASARPCN